MKNILENRNNLLLIALVGILLLVVALPTGKSETAVTTDTGKENESKEQVEERLEQVLKSTEGVGEVRVMITETEEKGTFEENSNQCNVQGVVVVAQGAEDAGVKKKIQDIVLALFPIEAHKIEIVKMKPN